MKNKTIKDSIQGLITDKMIRAANDRERVCALAAEAQDLLTELAQIDLNEGTRNECNVALHMKLGAALKRLRDAEIYMWSAKASNADANELARTIGVVEQ